MGQRKTVIMANTLMVMVFLTKILSSLGQEDIAHHEIAYPHSQVNQEHPSYSFGYGVADTHTGDIKTVWEAKEGDSVKGHYSVVEPDGSMRSVEYSTGPKSGFSAMVNNEDIQIPNVPVSSDAMEEKALRDYGRQYDYSEDQNYEPPSMRERKRKRHPYEALFRDYEFVKRPKYPADLEPSDYTHSISIKHPRDDIGPEATAESHIGFNFDPDCKHKHKIKESNYYPNVPDFDFRRQKYPPIDSYKSEYEKYMSESSNNMEKLAHMYKHNDQYKPVKPQDEFGEWSPTKNDYHGIPDIPPEKLFADLPPLRPKNKHRPNKNPEPYEDLDDYILVPKRKNKKPPRFAEPPEYAHESDEEFDDAFDDDRYHKPPRPSNQKEVVRKIVKKKKPVINLLDIFDI
ncbi:uncharacterized protein LOC121731405 [Aricia agestis]|uniref:uncharacterized protein LOC121731405 n=1 Tax=Aricia agestis TaxID=91739 RepID=UPI001C209743|nr:uncharacterized protein LOC121731405 [Aricia agestis]